MDLTSEEWQGVDGIQLA